ncbi:cytochrome P450 93A2-like [Syzygium oleosum]|uniref:cytochrome P450 93A2-like n=1 Tax=Syzygium oleosum TaxID=219896 RepID=UPI0011D1D5F2|nr:cytochrome P450 93A2-like [Syzygium oleosum]
MAVDIADYIFLLFFFLFSTLIFSIFHSSKRKPARSPPSPLALPILGHFHLLSAALPKSLEALARRYGSLMQISIGSSRFLVASDAATAQQILRAHDVEFASKFVFAPSHHNIFKEAEFVNAPYGTYWKFMKRLCMTKLFAGPQLERFSHIREDETMKLLRSLWKCHQLGEPCNLSTKLTALTNNMLCRMAMSKRCSRSGDQAHEIRERVRDTMACGARLSFAEVHGPLKHVDLFGNGKRLRTALRKFDALIEQIIKEYEDDCGEVSEEKDVMDILLETYRDPNAEIRLTRDQIKHFFLDLLIAGVDTTSASMQWAIIELLKHPQLLKKLRKEIDSAVGSTRLVNESDVQNLPYLQAVVKETLRLHTPGPLLRRKCNSDCEINGYDIKAGTNILINAYAIMHDPGTWENPDEFVPERFMVGEGDDHHMELKGQDFHYLPFGSGRRACIGVAHAAIVMHTAIGGLIQCFDLKGGEKVDIKLVTGYSGAMANPLVCYPIGLLNPTVLHAK